MKHLLPLILFVFLAPSVVRAQEESQLERVAFTEAPQDDPVFGLMGEFVGPIQVGENRYEPLGLQIRALGNDQFEALQYAGGLPGQKTFKAEEPVKLVGRRSGEFVVLSGGPWAIFVEQNDCMIVDRKGNKVGRLERIRRGSPTMGAQPPEGATVLFDGTHTDQFTSARMTEDGLLMEGADTKPMFQDFNLHVEFRLPYMPHSLDQQRGNSGCYLQSRYEVQVLDSFATVPVFNGCSSIYRFKAPDLNMCYPPLQWQTYDIQFTAPRWAADGTKTRNARLTVWQNGVKTQDNVELPNKTGAGKPEEPTLLPIRFQNHRDPVRYRNIWIVDRGLSLGEFPVNATTQTTSHKSKAPKTKPKKRQPELLKSNQKTSEPEKTPSTEKPEVVKEAVDEQAKAKKDVSKTDSPDNDANGESAGTKEASTPASDKVKSEPAQKQKQEKSEAPPEATEESSAESSKANVENSSSAIPENTDKD